MSAPFLGVLDVKVLRCDGQLDLKLPVLFLALLDDFLWLDSLEPCVSGCLLLKLFPSA